MKGTKLAKTISVVSILALGCFLGYQSLLVEQYFPQQATLEIQTELSSNSEDAKQQSPSTFKNTKEPFEEISTDTGLSSNPKFAVKTDGPTEQIRTDEPTKQSKTDGPTEQIRTDEPTKQSKTNGPTEQIRTDEPTKQSKTDGPTEQIRTDEPTEQSKTNGPTEQIRTDEPTKQSKTDGPTEQIRTDEPTKQSKTDGPTEQIRTDEPTKQSKTDGPTMQVKTNEPTEQIRTDEPAKQGKTDAPTELNKTDENMNPKDDQGSYVHWIDQIPTLQSNESLAFVDNIVLKAWHMPSTVSELLAGPYQLNETLLAASRRYLKIREKGQLLSLGRKLLNREALQVHMIGGSNTAGRVDHPYFDRFMHILNSKFSPLKGHHQLTRTAQGGATSCHFATEFKMKVQNKLFKAPPDVIFFEFQVNDFSEGVNCLEALMTRFHWAAPQSTKIALGLHPNARHKPELDFHLITQVDIGPLISRASNVLFPKFVRNNDVIVKQKRKGAKYKTVVTDGRHIQRLGTIITVHAMVALLVEAMAITRDSTQTGIVPSDPRWDEQRRHKFVSNYDLLMEPRNGATVLVEDVAAIVASCSDLLEAGESHGATDLSACREHVLSVAMNRGSPRKQQHTKGSLYCDAEAFATGPMQGSFASRGNSREQCLKELGKKASDPYSFKKLGWGWTQCFSPWRAVCRKSGVNNEHCSNTESHKSGMLILHYQNLQMRKPNSFTKASISLNVLKGYDSNFGRAIVFAWRTVWVNGTQVVNSTDPLLLDSFWSQKSTVGHVVGLASPLLVNGTEKKFHFNVAVLPLNEKVIRTPPCRFQVNEVVVEFND